MTGLRIAPMEARHIPEVLAIEKASNTLPWSEHAFKTETESEHGMLLVATLEQRVRGGEPLGPLGVVGYAGAWLIVDEAHITTVAVHPGYRRQGIARKLIESLLEACASRGATCSTLEVRAGNAAAIELYESLGFVRAALRRKYYADNSEDAVVMWLHRFPSQKTLR